MIGEMDEFTFTATSGDVVTLSLADTATGSFAPRAILYSPSGSEVERVGSGEKNICNLNRTGTFRIEVRDVSNDATGNYVLALEGLKPATPNSPTIALGDVKSGSIAAMGEVDEYTFTGAVGDVVTLSLAGTDTGGFHPRAALYSPSGAEVKLYSATTGSRVDEVEGGKKILSDPLPAAGTFVIQVYDNDYTNTGSYNLALEGLKPASVDATLTALGDVKNGTIDKGEIDEYKFTGTANGVVTVSLSEQVHGTDSELWAKLYSPLGEEVEKLTGTSGPHEAENGNKVIYKLPNVTGTYVVQVYDGDYTHTEDYAVAVEGLNPTSADAVAISLGGTVAGSLAVGEVDAYTFAGTAGAAVTLALAADMTVDYKPEATLYAPTGTSVCHVSFGNQTSCSLTTTGTHVIQVYDGDYTDPGAYNVTLGGPAEITVLGKGVVIADGDASPATTDGTDFGTVTVGAAAPTRNFTVRNDGAALLTLGTVTVPAGFTLTEGLSASLAPGASDTFTVQLDTATAGTKTGAVSFPNNDGNESPFNFSIKGIVAAPAAEIVVLGKGLIIVDGDTTPAASDDTDFGSVALGAAGPAHTFTVRNDGTDPLTLGSVSVPAGFTLTEGLATSLAAGASDTFTVRLDTATGGTKTGAISFATNDSNENPFDFAIKGVVTAPGPEITVLYSGVLIYDGDTTPAAADGTDFGSVALGAAGPTRTYTVRNEGTDTLTLGSVAVPAGFTLTESLAASLAAGASDTFTVRLETATGGTKSGAISFANNDSDENPFDFSIKGLVTVPAAEITVLGNGVSIADGDATPGTADGTDFGSAAIGAAGPTRTFTVRNEGTDTLTLGSVAVPAGFTLTEGLTASLAAGAADTFTVRLDTITGGTKTGALSFTTNDSDENPFDFAITGTVTGAAPEITVLGNGLIIANGAYSPSASNGTEFGAVLVGSPGPLHTFTVQNDGDAALTLANLAVPEGYTITEGLAASLAAGAADTFTVRLDTVTVGTKSGQITFATNDGDENPFHFTITGVVGDADAEIAVFGNSLSIVSGDGTPSLADHTDFGDVSRGAMGPVRTFTVRNQGISPLLLGTLTVPADFTLLDGLPASLAAGALDTFQVQMQSETAGVKSGQIALANSDSDESPFLFSITGTVHPVLHNPDIPEDVNGDGYVTAIDVLLVIDYLNNARPSMSVMYADVSGDGFLSPLDALKVIDYINSHLGTTSGEAEAPAVAEAVAAPAAASLRGPDGPAFCTPQLPAALSARPPAREHLAVWPVVSSSATAAPASAARRLRTAARGDDDLASVLDAIAPAVAQAWQTLPVL